MREHFFVYPLREYTQNTQRHVHTLKGYIISATGATHRYNLARNALLEN